MKTEPDLRPIDLTTKRLDDALARSRELIERSTIVVERAASVLAMSSELRQHYPDLPFEKRQHETDLRDD